MLADAERVVEDLELDCDVEVGFREAPEDDMRYGPYVTDEDHPLVDSLASATESVVGIEPTIGYFSSVSDFNYFGHRAELPTVILGPDGENIHGTGEFVYTGEVVEIAEIIVAAARSYVG